MSKKKLKFNNGSEIDVDFDKNVDRIIGVTTGKIALEMAKSIDNDFMGGLIMVKGFIDDVAEYNRLPNRFYKRKRILADAIVMESKYVLKIVKDYIAVLPPVKFKRYGELTANVKR